MFSLDNIKAKSEDQQMALDNCIAIWRTGSHLYGTSTPTSDEDYEGIFIEEPEYIVGIKRCDEADFGTGSNNTRNTKEDTDLKLYSLRKFMSLVALNNPNKVESLYVPIDQVVYQGSHFNYFLELQKNASLFLSKKLKHSFSGYAFEQKKKFIGKKKRLDELRFFQKVLDKYLAEGKTLIGEMDIFETVYNKKFDKEADRVVEMPVKRLKNGLINNFLVEQIEKSPVIDQVKFDGDGEEIVEIPVKGISKDMTYIKYHMTQEGNDAVMVDDKIYNFGMSIQKIYENISHQIDAYGHRTAALDEHSFDCKFASHVFRLIQEGVDLLTKGKLIFPCANATFQLEVKQGKYDLDTILNKIEEMEPLLEKASEESTLQHAPRRHDINILQTKLIIDYWKDKNLI